MIQFRILDKNDKSGRVRYATHNNLYNRVEEIVGDKLADNGIPVAIEVEGWGELAGVDEVYETDDIVVIIEEI